MVAEYKEKAAKDDSDISKLVKLVKRGSIKQCVNEKRNSRKCSQKNNAIAANVALIPRMLARETSDISCCPKSIYGSSPDVPTSSEPSL